MPIRFRIRWVPLCATLMIAAAGIMLGQWQSRRAEDKIEIQQRLESRARQAPLQVLPADSALDETEFRHVSLAGQFIPQWAIYLENRPHAGVSGFHVLMPFKIAGSSQVVMVGRGWAPRDAVDRTRLPQLVTPTGVVRIQGVLRKGAGHVLQLGQPDPPRPDAILQNLDIVALAEASALPLSSAVIEQTDAADDGLVRDWPLPSLGVERHRAYALQWYALAAMALIFFLVTGFKRGRNDKA